jgi:hypothetical protein
MTTRILYIGCAQLGISASILAPLQAYARHYKMDVIHLGPLATEDEIKMYRLRTKKLATWEKQLNELSGSTSLTPEEEKELVQKAYNELVSTGRDSAYSVDWEDLCDEELTSKDVTRLTRMLISHVNYQKISHELIMLEEAQNARVAVLNSVFPGIKYIFSEKQVLQFDKLIASLPWLGTEMVGKHINAISMPANGMNVAHAPITPRTISVLAWIKKSFIMPHPIPMSDSRASEGLNNARNYYTTGMLYMPEAPTEISDLHKGKHIPGAVVCVYGEDGSFYANNLIIDGLPKMPFIAEDGMVFSRNGVEYVSGGDVGITFADLHSPYVHWGVVNAGVHVGKETKAETVVINGDGIDHEADNRHAAGAPGLVENKRTRQDLDAGKSMTAYIEKGGFRNKVYILGNHEGWLTQLVERHPSLKGLLDWHTVSREWFAGWKFIMRNAGGNEVFKFGNLNYRHGDEESLQASIEALGNTINGHWHRYYRIGQSGKQGAACTLGPKYVGNNLTAWQSQFTVQTKHRELTSTSYKTCLHNDTNKTSSFVFRNSIITVSQLQEKTNV